MEGMEGAISSWKRRGILGFWGGVVGRGRSGGGANTK
jgi:hypothetical protein